MIIKNKLHSLEINLCFKHILAEFIMHDIPFQLKI